MGFREIQTEIGLAEGEIESYERKRENEGAMENLTHFLFG